MTTSTRSICCRILILAVACCGAPADCDAAKAKKKTPSETDQKKPVATANAPSIEAIASPAIAIALSKPAREVAPHELVQSDFTFEVAAADAPRQVLVVSEWIPASPDPGGTIQRLGCTVPSKLEGTKGEFQNSTWLPTLAIFLLEARQKGKGNIRVALFEAVPEGTGQSATYGFGKQLSNPLLLPAFVRGLGLP